MFDGRSRLAKEVSAQLESFLKEQVFQTMVPRKISTSRGTQLRYTCILLRQLIKRSECLYRICKRSRKTAKKQ